MLGMIASAAFVGTLAGVLSHHAMNRDGRRRVARAEAGSAAMIRHADWAERTLEARTAELVDMKIRYKELIDARTAALASSKITGAA